MMVRRTVGDTGLRVPYVLKSFPHVHGRYGPLSQPILKVIVERRILIDGIEEGTHERSLFLVEQWVSSGRWWIREGRKFKGCIWKCGRIVFIVVRGKVMKGCLFHQVCWRHLKGRYTGHIIFPQILIPWSVLIRRSVGRFL